MAMQLLGNLFEYELARRSAELNISGATSGDTGSAAEYAMRGKKGVRVFMTSPLGRMSPFQQAQMFSLLDENIHNIAIEGVFDDCQDIVKAASATIWNSNSKYKIGTVNSINWARLLAQVVYYFAGYFQATQHDTSKGELLRSKWKLWQRVRGSRGPHDGVCQSINWWWRPTKTMCLDEFFKTGVYRVRGTADTHETSSPSMDISKASNFERFVFDLLKRDASQIKNLFHDQLNQNGRFDLSGNPLFADARINIWICQWQEHACGSHIKPFKKPSPTITS
jgi:threonine synthase